MNRVALLNDARRRARIATMCHDGRALLCAAGDAFQAHGLPRGQALVTWRYTVPRIRYAGRVFGGVDAAVAAALFDVNCGNKPARSKEAQQ